MASVAETMTKVAIDADESAVDDDEKTCWHHRPLAPHSNLDRADANDALGPSSGSTSPTPGSGCDCDDGDDVGGSWSIATATTRRLLVDERRPLRLRRSLAQQHRGFVIVPKRGRLLHFN